MKHYNSVDFLSNFRMSTPCTNVNSSNWRPSDDGSVGNVQRQGIALCTCNWKRSKTIARPSAQVTMKTASQGFSTIVLNLYNIFFKMGPRTCRGLHASDDRVNVRSLLYKRIKPLLKREVNHETFFTSLRSYYQISLVYVVDILHFS